MLNVKRINKNKTVEWIILILIITVIIFAFIKSHKGKGYKYRKTSPLFSAAERSFLGVLDQAISDKYRIFGKVRVADILTPAKGMSRKNWQIAFNKISAKHFDYILCSKDKLDVLAAIELDDKSHKSDKMKNRDSLLEAACESADLKLIRFQAKRSYHIQSVRDEIELSLNPQEANVSLNKASKPTPQSGAA